ncbi:MAG TPA: hypothetical protein VFZ27_11885 [Terriglobia bacterium]|nr:hypothetical protein [Terriglobia bacterium]
MSNRDRLHSYLKQVEKRLRLDALLRGAVLLSSTALAATFVLVFITNGLAFSPASVVIARVALFSVLALALVLGLVRPLHRINDRRAAGRTETAFPQFQQRLVTFVERDARKADPFVELLAADTLKLTQDAKPESLASQRKLMLSLAGSIASLGVLIWTIAAGPGYLGYGAARLWATSSRETAAFYDIHVTPGDAAVRRNTSQTVNAQLVGFESQHARLYARYKSASKWQSAEMQPQPENSGFQFEFAALPEDVDYYIEAGRVRTRHFKLRVVDPPHVKRIRVTYHYPSWTGLHDKVEESGGDLRAVQGTSAELALLTDRPLRGGALVLKSGQQITLSGGPENLYRGKIEIDKNGAYHIAALDRGQLVRLSDDFFIEANKANPPEVTIRRPQGDYRASPIEEVTVAVKGSDDYGLRGMSLHYSVNGGPEQAVNVLKKKGAKDAEGSAVLYLENFKVVPGDVVSYYAQARDGRSSARSAMFFLEVQPFDREYSQSQVAGGGGMGGQQQSDISRRQKEIIAATWKQESDKNAARQRAAGTAKFLSSAQNKLRDQALMLAARVQARGLSEANDEFSAFQRDMNAAASAMTPASEKLGRGKWKDALPNEQKALQQLLRAEATFRRIQVAFGSQGGGGAGAGRDLADLSDLELDTQKNQYETGQTAQSAGQRAQQMDKTLQKLDELAQREQQLANQRSNSSVQNFQQRWQQEMLHREAEQLQKQLEQLAQNMARGQQGNSQGANPSSPASSANNGASQNTANGSLQRAVDRLREANSAMRRAQSPGANAADARRAAQELAEARRLLNGLGRQQASGQLDSLARESDRLASEAHNQAARLKKMFGARQQSQRDWPRFDGGSQQESKLADDRQLLASDLSRLKKELQDSARQLQSSQPGVASKLSQALGETERADLENRLNRSAESIRRGTDPNSRTLGPAITSGIDRMNEQVHEAQQALKAPSANPAEEQLARVERLRRGIEALTRNSSASRNGQPGELSRGGPANQQAQNGQANQSGGENNGSQSGQPGELSRGGPANQQAQNGQANQSGGQNNGFQSGGPGGPRAWRSGQNPGLGRFIEGPGSGREGSSGPSASDELAVREALRQLEGLRRQLRSDPYSSAEIEQLMRDLPRLGAAAYGAKPAVVQQLAAQALASVDRIELQLRRQLDGQRIGQVRNGDSLQVPPGYDEPVAAYFRRLSQSH